MFRHITSPSLLNLIVLSASLLALTQPLFAQDPAAGAATATSASATAIPTPILNARTVFLANGGSDGGLFPEPFSGDPNRGYFALLTHLKSAAKYDLVSDPSEADLVMQIQLAAPNGPREPAKQYGAADPLPFFKLIIYDAKTRFVLWTITEPIEWAVLQKTHDRNFDDALARLSADIQALSQRNAASLYAQPLNRLVPGWKR